MTKLRLFEAFSGIGAQAKALKNIGVDFESVVLQKWMVKRLNRMPLSMQTQAML